MSADLFAALFLRDPQRRAVLDAVAALALPDWAIGAGFVRNAVWDRLHGNAASTPLNDVDVLYFDPGDVAPARDEALERRLVAALPGVPWSVRNQARMHRRNGDAPYKDTEDAMRHWLESATCVAVRLETDGRLGILAPFGLDDLLALRSRPTAQGRARSADYLARMRRKDWPARWPRVSVEGL
jgi:hypothetical protein